MLSTTEVSSTWKRWRLNFECPPRKANPQRLLPLPLSPFSACPFSSVIKFVCLWIAILLWYELICTSSAFCSQSPALLFAPPLQRLSLPLCLAHFPLPTSSEVSLLYPLPPPSIRLSSALRLSGRFNSSGVADSVLAFRTLLSSFACSPSWSPACSLFVFSPQSGLFCVKGLLMLNSVGCT